MAFLVREQKRDTDEDQDAVPPDTPIFNVSHRMDARKEFGVICFLAVSLCVAAQSGLIVRTECGEVRGMKFILRGPSISWDSLCNTTCGKTSLEGHSASAAKVLLVNFHAA